MWRGVGIGTCSNLRDSRFKALLPSVLTDGSLVNGHPDRDFGIRSGRCVDWNDIAFPPGPAPLHDLITESAHTWWYPGPQHLLRPLLLRSGTSL